MASYTKWQRKSEYVYVSTLRLTNTDSREFLVEGEPLFDFATSFLARKSFFGKHAMLLAVLRVAVGMLLAGGAARGQEGYQKPPEAVLEVLNAPVTPRASVGKLGTFPSF